MRGPMSAQEAPPSGSSLFHGKYRVSNPSRRPEHYPRGQEAASTALQGGVPHLLAEGAIGFAGFDHGVNSAGHPGGDVGVSLATRAGVVRNRRDVSLEFVAEAASGLQHGGLTG